MQSQLAVDILFQGYHVYTPSYEIIVGIYGPRSMSVTYIDRCATPYQTNISRSHMHSAWPIRPGPDTILDLQNHEM